jgi:NarL family two-component system response regulator LiaR
MILGMPLLEDGIPIRYTMMQAHLIQILIVDDHAMVRRGLKILLEQFPGIQVVGEAADGLQAIDLVSRLQPDVVLMDLVMPVMDGIEAIQRIIAIQPAQSIIVLTASADSKYFVQAIQAGAQGYFVKDLDAEELVQAIRNVHHGRPAFDSRFIWEVIRKTKITEIPQRLPDQLSEKELVILRMLTHGLTDQDIARELVVTEVTVRTHISRIIRKLRLENRVQAVLYSLRSGLVPESEIAKLMAGPYD